MSKTGTRCRVAITALVLALAAQTIQATTAHAVGGGPPVTPGGSEVDGYDESDTDSSGWGAVEAQLSKAPGDYEIRANPTDASSSLNVAKASAAATVINNCNATWDNYRLVKEYSRPGRWAGSYYVGSGQSHLKCGNSGWGWRHIIYRHENDWSLKATYTGQNWRELFDYASYWVMSDPDKTSAGSSSSGVTFCYSRFFYLVYKPTGQTKGTMTVKVPFAMDSQNIITAYPASSQC